MTDAYLAEIAARIEKRSFPVTESGCWIWMGHLHRDGYGWIRFSNQAMSASRASWMAFRGPIPTGLYVLHHCDIRSCVNPDHLFLGTHLDNIADMVRKGRARGNPLGRKSWCTIAMKKS